MRAEKLKADIPMNKIGKPDEIAEIVMWLISDKSSYVCGALIDVSGGR